MKLCLECNVEKPASEFGKKRANKNGLMPYCRPCSNTISRSRSHLRRQSVADRYRLYQHNAKTRGCEFTLSLDHFRDLTIQTCTYCDKYTEGKQHVGIDRLVNTEGYTIGNSVPCCWTCNRMKRDMTVETFMEQVRSIV